MEQKKMSPLTKKNISISTDGVFTLNRRTRSGVPNVNGYTYTHEAFESAIARYVKEPNAGLYLAPVSVSESAFGDNIKNKTSLVIKANTEIYGKFNVSMSRDEYLSYRIAEILSWDDYTITFRKIEMAKRTEDLFSKYVLDDSPVQMRYSADVQKGIVKEMKIICFDLSVIPYEELGIDIKRICGGK